MLTQRNRTLWLLVLPGLFLAGCSRNDLPTAAGPVAGSAQQSAISAGDPPPPTGLVAIAANGGSIEVWPYTGSNFVTPSDPLNLVFVGDASVAKIRAALMSLDGNRNLPGIPPIAPFNQTWTDGMGGVQTAYVDDAGWLGSVVQLQLGDYAPVRIHLRLFEARLPAGDIWTLGGAHFEFLIPGTADYHQPLSWELAEQIVVYDLMRSGLVVAGPTPTGGINPAPGYRTIPPAIYNAIPDGLKLICQLPPGPSATPVPIPTNGAASVLTLGSSSPAADATDQEFTLQYNLIVPRPFCSGGPLDYLLVQGPVSLRQSVLVAADGRYEYEAEIRGHLVATPVDVTQNPPVPIGEPFNVNASDVQHGFLGAHDARVAMQSNRLVIGDGAEKQFIRLVVHERGADQFRERVQCLKE